MTTSCSLVDRNTSLHSVDFVATSPLEGRGIVLLIKGDTGGLVGLHYIASSSSPGYPPASWICPAPQDIVPEKANEKPVVAQPVMAQP